jgi:hypothetical protein
MVEEFQLVLKNIDPQMLEDFINDALFCFDEDLARYLE